MKILLHSYNFYPMIGGIETVSETLAHHWRLMGIDCTVVTDSNLEDGDDSRFNFPVIRNPTIGQKIKLAKSHDLIFSNGNSFAMLPYALIAGKPFCWSLQTYELQCIDALGWHDGKPAPLSPMESFKFYLRSGLVSKAISGGIKLFIKRWFAINYVKANIAITEWVANRVPLPNQVVIYNAFPLEKFKKASLKSEEFEYTFIFLGRLVSEKGVDVLLHAFAALLKNNSKTESFRLALVGDGPDRNVFENLARTLQIENNVFFLGKKRGEELLEAVSKGMIAIVPSTWEEPMGGVALELMAAGKNIIVSKRGGLAELVGEAGFTFDNGNAIDLMEKMQLLMDDETLRKKHLTQASFQLEKFREKIFVDQYAELFQNILAKKVPSI